MVGRFLTLPKLPLEAGSGWVSFSIAEEREKSAGVSLVMLAEKRSQLPSTLAPNLPA